MSDEGKSNIHPLNQQSITPEVVLSDACTHVKWKYVIVLGISEDDIPRLMISNTPIGELAYLEKFLSVNVSQMVSRHLVRGSR